MTASGFRWLASIGGALVAACLTVSPATALTVAGWQNNWEGGFHPVAFWVLRDRNMH